MSVQVYKAKYNSVQVVAVKQLHEGRLAMMNLLLCLQQADSLLPVDPGLHLRPSWFWFHNGAATQPFRSAGLQNL